MEFEQSRLNIPLGKARELEAKKETLPAVEVENKVIWVNSDLELPFNLEVGKSTELGIFLTPQSEMPEDHSTRVGIFPYHNRSGLLGRVIFRAREETEGSPEVGQEVRTQLYRDIDIKGLGYSKKKRTLPGEAISPTEVLPVKKFSRRRFFRTFETTLGILNLEDADHDAMMAELLHKQGIRTHRVIAIIGLDEIVDKEGRKITVKEAKKLGILLESDKPVLEIRAFGTKTRLKDVLGLNNTPEIKELLLEDARILVAQELGKDPAKFSRLEYFSWLATATGRNIGLLRKNKWKHLNLGQGHNITLDGRLVDFDSISKMKPWEIYSILNMDSFSSEEVLKKFFDSVGLDETQQRIILDEYTDAYNKAKK